MLKLLGNNIYLAALERKDCKKLYEDEEFDFGNPTEMLNIGYSVESSDKWFEEIQEKHNKQHIRLGIFLNDNTVIGNVALQDIDWNNRSCTIGMGFSKLEYRNKGYSKQALALIIEYAFNQIGLERISAATLEMNIPAKKSLEKFGFIMEGIERKAVYFGGKRYDRHNYGLLSTDKYCKI